MIDIDQLEALAKAALSRGEEDCESLDDWLSAEEFMSNMLLHPIDARFAEACKPKSILELCAEVRRLRQRETLLFQVATYADSVCGLLRQGGLPGKAEALESRIKAVIDFDTEKA